MCRVMTIVLDTLVQACSPMHLTQCHGCKAVSALKYNTMKAYGRMEVLLHLFLTMSQDISFTSRLFYPRYPLNKRFLWVPVLAWTLWQSRKTAFSQYEYFSHLSSKSESKTGVLGTTKSREKLLYSQLILLARTNNLYKDC
jgi:hypothetical protein